MRNLVLLLFALPAYAQQQREVNVGPIWNQPDAETKCRNACQPPEHWNGQWRTTIPGRMSVCGCVTDAPPMEVHGRYERLDRSDSIVLQREGKYRRQNGETGSWRFDGRVVTLQPDPTILTLQPDGTLRDPQNVVLRREGWHQPEPVHRSPPEMAGSYQGTHPQWRDTVTLGADGRFARSNGDPGSWWFEGNVLYLKWDRWGMASLAMQPDGSFFDGAQNFRLARNVVVQAPPPREFRSRYLHLDRGWYRPNEQPIVYWDNLPQANGAWVSIVPRGTADGEWGDWSYTRGAASGSFTARNPLPAGEYEVRAYGGSMSPVVDRLIFTVGR
jgi:hypothetical protein